MKDKQPEALLNRFYEGEEAKTVITEATNELRRLHQENQELIEALSLMCDTFLDTEGSHGQLERNSIEKAHTILAKHREQA